MMALMCIMALMALMALYHIGCGVGEQFGCSKKLFLLLVVLLFFGLRLDVAYEFRSRLRQNPRLTNHFRRIPNSLTKIVRRLHNHFHDRILSAETGWLGLGEDGNDSEEEEKGLVVSDMMERAVKTNSNVAQPGERW